MNEDPLPPISATQCRDPDAAQRIRDAAAAGRERRLMEAKRQRAVLAAAVKDYRMAQEEWHQLCHDEASYCQTLLHDAMDRDRIPKRAWQAVEQEMLQVMDQFKHKKRRRPAMLELLGRPDADATMTAAIQAAFAMRDAHQAQRDLELVRERDDMRRDLADLRSGLAQQAAAMEGAVRSTYVGSIDLTVAELRRISMELRAARAALLDVTEEITDLEANVQPVSGKLNRARTRLSQDIQSLEEAARTAVMRIQSTCAQLGTDPAAHLSEFNVR